MFFSSIWFFNAFFLIQGRVLPVLSHKIITLIQQVFEDAPVGTTVLVISATDNDVGINAQITYSLGEELGDTDRTPEFSINPQTGAIVTTKQLDRETVNGYLLTVTAKDGGNPPLSDTTDVEISVTDVNDNFPIFKQPLYSGSVLEDALVGKLITFICDLY